MIYIRTAYGAAFDLERPTPDMVDIRDIAHALARICRFTGHVGAAGYSVAQHSVHVSVQAAYAAGAHGAKAMMEAARRGLMHDAAEAYVGDVSRPMKVLCPEVGIVERRVRKAVFARFGIGPALAGEPACAWNTVKDADDRMLATEFRDLMPVADEVGAEPYDDMPRLMVWPVEDAEAAFLGRFKALFGEATSADEVRHG